jgi:hypothetical protein
MRILILIIYVDIAFCTVNFAAFWPEIFDFNLYKDFLN